MNEKELEELKKMVFSISEEVDNLITSSLKKYKDNLNTLETTTILGQLTVNRLAKYFNFCDVIIEREYEEHYELYEERMKEKLEKIFTDNKKEKCNGL